MECDYVVLECGIGARIDATNVVQPEDIACSVITSIGFDHMDVLGNTEEEIAAEIPAELSLTVIAGVQVPSS